MKRIVCMLVLAAMVLAMIPANVFAAEMRTVYLDPTNGTDTNSGLEETKPVKTVEAAYNALAGADEGKIVLQSTLTLSAETTFPACSIPVTITGAGITTGNHIFFSGDTTLENLTLTLTAENNTRYLSSEGHDLTIGEGVVCKNSASYRFCLTTRYGEGSVDGATLTVKSGSWRNIFAAGYTKATTGDATLIVTGGNINNMLAPTYSGNVTGNVTMRVSGVTGGVFCVAPNQTGTLTGNVELTLGDGVTGKVRVKRLYQNATVNGTATVIIDGDCTGLTEINHNGTGAGSISKTRLVLKSGALDVTPCDFDEVALEIPQEKTMTLRDSAIVANTVNSLGTLQFSGNASLTALAVTGGLNCDVLDTPKEGHSYVTAPAGSAITFPEITNVKEFDGTWQLSGDFNAAAFKGLVLTTTADGITVELYSGFSTDSSKLMTPVHTEGRDRYYAVTSGSSYYCISKPASGSGRYTIHKTIYITEEEANQKIVMDVTPGVRTTTGWDTPNAVNNFTDEVLAKAFPSNASLWPQYSEIFTTPVFQAGRNDHMQTTQTELENFLKQLDDPDDNIYVYTIGQTAMKSFNVPLVVVTDVDLSGAKTLEEAAILIREDSEKNQKLTVHYQAQIHGNEPAAGEAALGMIKRLDGEYGKTLLDSMNIYVIPRLNPYGAYKSSRNTWTDSSTSVDPNRDFLRLRTSEAQMRMQAYNLFEPDVVFDNHEYQFALTSSSITKRDMMLCTHFLPVSTQVFKDTAVELAYAAFDQLEKDNLSYSWYSSTADNYSLGGVGGNTGSSNTSLRGTFHILMETLGSNYGTNMYERRVASHASSVTGVLNYLNTHAAQVKAAVKTERDTTVENGKTYEEDDIVMLKTASNDYAQYHIDGKKVNLKTGAETNYTFRALVADTVVRSRPAPTAYVIGADESFTKTVLDLMDKQGISYSYLPADSVLMLQQYTGTVTEATLTNEKPVSFPQGAYVFTMNQVDALILACLMEPDVNFAAEHKGTLVQQGIITATDGVFPIYRYIRDLNAQGTVDLAEALAAAPEGLTSVGATTIGGTGKIIGLDATKPYEYRAKGGSTYTAVAAGATEITDLPIGTYYVRYAVTEDGKPSADTAVTVGYGLLDAYVVYLDSENGTATGDGYTQATAVNTLTLAQKQLSAIIADAPAGTTGTIVIVGTYTVNSSQQLPVHNYPVLYTGGTMLFKDTASGNKAMTIGGDTTFDEITIGVGTASDSYYLYAKGHKLVIGENVTVQPYVSGSTNYYMSVVGGGTGTVSKTDLTIRSGYWYSVYAGSYAAQVTGDVRLELENCSVSRVTPAYNATVDGDVSISLKNVTVRTGIYCGNTKAKNVGGDVTITLGEGVTAPEIYAGSRDAGNVAGTVTVIADGIDLTENTIYGKAKNSSGTIGGLKLVLNKGQLADMAASFLTGDGIAVVLGCDQTKAVTIPVNVALDMNGCNASNVTVADGKTLTVCDNGETLGVLAATGNVVAAEGFEEIAVTGGKSYPKAGAAAIPGDVDGDGDKDTNDAVYLLLSIMFGETDYPIANPHKDLNGDSEVDTNDAVYLLLHVMFGEEDYPLTA